MRVKRIVLRGAIVETRLLKECVGVPDLFEDVKINRAIRRYCRQENKHVEQGVHKFFFLLHIKGDAKGAARSAGDEEPKALRAHCRVNGRAFDHDAPAEDDVETGDEPFGAVEPEAFDGDADERRGPDGRCHGQAALFGQGQHHVGCVGAGDEHVD